MSGFIGDTMSSILGQGRPGAQPPGGLLGGGGGSNGGSGMNGASSRGRDRKILRKAFGNSALLKSAPFTAPVCMISPGCGALSGHTHGLPITPFRAATNAGDVVATVNQGPIYGGVNQVNTIGASKLHANGGGIHHGSAYYSGNPRYVYDGSDYTRFKKLQAKNKNYNDSSFGGSNNGSYTFLMGVRS